MSIDRDILTSINKMPNGTLFITFEGIEGSGKTTQIKLLNDALKLRGYEAVLTREPGGTKIGDEVRKIVLDSKHSQMSSLCELFLIAAARAQHVQEVIQPALKAGQIVLCDRFIDATTAYQGYGRGFPLNLINQLNSKSIDGVKPTLTFLLDCLPRQGLKRAMDRMAKLGQGSKEDRFEREPMDFHEKVRAGYLKVAEENKDRFVVIREGGDIEGVHQIIAKHVIQVLEKL